MAQGGFYHCAVKPIGRAMGRSAVAAAAYRAAEVLRDERTGLTHHYAERGGVFVSFIVAPSNAPAWATDRERLWNAAEAATTAKNGRVATELELALPHELTADQRRALIESFARDLSERYKVAVDVAIHGPGRGGDNRNHHAHVMLTHRELGPDGFGAICNGRTIERIVKGQTKAVNVAGINPDDTTSLRKAWAEALNGAYQEAGLDMRADHRSHKDRGMTAEPTHHLGPSASGIERRGEASSRGDLNREITARNTQLERIEDERLTLTSAIADIMAEREARADRRELRAAVRTTSADRILEAMTEKRATFSRAELVRTLGRVVEERAEAGSIATELLAHPDIIGLRENAAANVTRYTTRGVLADEREIMQTARALAEHGGRGLTEKQRNAALKNHQHLDEEQRAAFEHATSGRGLTFISGEAGSGKSTTLAAVREAYEAAGYRVVGLTWTNSVMQDMAADGFKEVSTLSAALGRADRAKEGTGYHTNRKGMAMKNRQLQGNGWNGKTVLIVDEAAMLSDRTQKRLLKEVLSTGARVVEVGDGQQMPSIERGGMWHAMTGQLGAASLSTVYRVKDQAQKLAYNLMHKGQFGEALAIFDKAGAINWTETQDEARTALAAQWAKDTKDSPDKNRFVFAYSNVDVLAINADLRAIRRERGELGEDHVLRTQDGPTTFAAGDRIQFTGSAYYRADKDRGLVTGAMGTIKAIDGQRVTMELDSKGKPRVVTFTVGAEAGAGDFDAIRHGYAGTIYKGQGKTLDESYLYHSQNWRAASAYVALSRHREKTSLFVAREVTRGRDPWMMQEGGLEGLDERQKAGADVSYQAWAEENRAAAEKFGLSRYVAYVQGKQAERGRSEYDLAQLVRQISRTDETRAASQFVTGDQQPQKPAGAGGATRPRLSGANRYAALKAAAMAMVRPVVDPIAQLIKRAGKPDANRYDTLRGHGGEAEKATPTTPLATDSESSRKAALIPPDIQADERKAAEQERKNKRNRSPGLDLG